MTDRQPNLKEARSAVSDAQFWLDLIASNNGHIRHVDDGFWYRQRRHRNWAKVTYAVSDITAKCELCSKMLRDAYVRRLIYLFDERGRRSIRYMHDFSDQEKIVCLSCYNQWRPLEDAARQSMMTSFMLRKAKAEVSNAKKHHQNVG